MLGNIKKNNVHSLKLRFNNDKFYDFMLYKGETYDNGISEICTTAAFEANTINDKNEWVSNILWEHATNENVKLDNFGLTGVDNGQIIFQKDRINGDDFINIFTNSSLTLENNFLTLKKVEGNTKQFVYPIERNENFVSLKGGFFQGFYKIEGEKYQVLPHVLENDWNVEIVLRKKDYEISDETLNSRYSENKGIFFYIGTRAENKFAYYYNGGEDKWCENITDNAFPEGYINEEETLEKVDVYTKDEFKINSFGEYDIETDNKHIFFNRTKEGFTVDTWDDSYNVVIREKKRKNENVFEIANRSKNGVTAEKIENILENVGKYDIYSDIRENAFALKINDDGSISYRYAITDCEKENKFSIKEESTKPNLIKEGEWYVVNTRFMRLNDKYMKISIYIDGKLVFVSQQLPIFNFRGLNDVPSKQETVPYNISIGGGTQGLVEGIWKNWYNINEEMPSPLADNFGGSFIGDIKSFRLYNCFLSHKDINDNVLKNK